MLKGFRNFLTQGDVVIVAIGLVIALAFRDLITAFTTNIIDPLVTRAQGNHPVGLGIQLGSAGNATTFLNFGALIGAVVYFIVFMLVVYYLIVVPYRAGQAKRGISVFGPPGPVKTCPACLSDDLPAAASKCKYCGTEQAAQPSGPAGPSA